MERIISFFQKKEKPVSVSIGLMQEKDIPAFSEFMGKEHCMDLVKAKEYYSEVFRMPEQFTILIAKDENGRIVGGIETATDNHCGKKAGFVEWIFVDKKLRGRGIATKLYQEYEKELINKGDVYYILAGISSQNGASLRLHKKMGVASVYDGNKYFASYYKALMKKL